MQSTKLLAVHYKALATITNLVETLTEINPDDLENLLQAELNQKNLNSQVTVAGSIKITTSHYETEVEVKQKWKTMLIDYEEQALEYDTDDEPLDDPLDW